LTGVAASFRVPTISSVINENAPHHLRGNGEKVSAILPMHIPLIHEPKKGLVDQRRCLQRVSRSLAVHVLLGQPV
jgi:hypothetical protein